MFRSYVEVTIRSLEKGHYATDDFFVVLDLPAVAGNPKAALRQTNKA